MTGRFVGPRARQAFEVLREAGCAVRELAGHMSWPAT
jgi:hypothetical protein